MKNETILDSLVLPRFESLPAFKNLASNTTILSAALCQKVSLPIIQTEQIMGSVFKACGFATSFDKSFAAFTQCGEIIKRWESTFVLPKAFTESVAAFNRLDSLYENTLQPGLNKFTKLPDLIIRFSTEELVLSRHCLEAFAEPAPAPKPLSIEVPHGYLLQSHDESLWKMLEGAQQALATKQTDYKRHILASLRELCTHLLHGLAPDSLIFSWISKQENSDELLNEKRPTRRARWLYICRDFDNNFIGDFVAHDAKALRILFEALNQMHQKEPSLSDNELEILLVRTRHFVEYVLTLSKGG